MICCRKITFYKWWSWWWWYCQTISLSHLPWTNERTNERNAECESVSRQENYYSDWRHSQVNMATWIVSSHSPLPKHFAFPLQYHIAHTDREKNILAQLVWNFTSVISCMKIRNGWFWVDGVSNTIMQCGNHIIKNNGLLQRDKWIEWIWMIYISKHSD